MADSWLFSKGGASVRILRTAPLTLVVCGPGRIRRFLTFATHEEMVAFIRDTEFSLGDLGFRFTGYATDRRGHAERRTLNRGLDRRSPAPW